jgi:hypothetical protein
LDRTRPPAKLRVFGAPGKAWLILQSERRLPW